LGSPRIGSVCLFQSPRTRYVRSTVPPVRLKTELILPGATPLQSAFVRAPRRSPCDDRLHLPLGFVPSSRHQSKAATFVRRASHAPLRSVLRFSQPRDGFFRSRPRGPIPSRSHVQGCLRSGASLPPQPPFLIEKSLPPCRCCFAAPTHGPTFAGSPVSPRATPLGFEAFICVRPRSSSPVIHLAQGRSPLRISRSSRFSLSRRRPPLSRSPSAHSVTRSVLANISAFRLRCFETTARPRFSLLVRTRQRVDPRAVPRLRGRRYGVTSRSSLCRGHVHLSMRGSCCRDSMSRSEDRSRSTFTLRCSCPALGLATEARDCASSLKDGHVPCSLFSAHVVLAFTVLVLAFVFRRSRSRPRSGHCRRPLPRFRAKRPSAFSLRVHDQDVLAALTTLVSTMRASRRSRAARPRLTVHGLASSCHVSTKAGHRSFEDRAPLLAPGDRARPRLSALTFASPYSSLRRAPVLRRLRLEVCRARLVSSSKIFRYPCSKPVTPCLRSPVRQDRLPLATEAFAPALRSTCISRRSRSIGTSVLTLAQRVRGSLHVHAPVQSHLSMTSIFRRAPPFGFCHLRMPRPAGLGTSRHPPPFGRRSSRDVGHCSRSSKPFGFVSALRPPQTSRDAA
jgi:hypothetical protein